MNRLILVITLVAIGAAESDAQAQTAEAENGAYRSQIRRLERQNQDLLSQLEARTQVLELKDLENQRFVQELLLQRPSLQPQALSAPNVNDIVREQGPMIQQIRNFQPAYAGRRYGDTVGPRAALRGPL